MDITIIAAVIGVLCAWAVLFTVIRRWGPGLATRRVRCPESGTKAKLTVEQQEGDFGCLRVADVIRCSLFPGGPLTCTKECLRSIRGTAG